MKSLFQNAPQRQRRFPSLLATLILSTVLASGIAQAANVADSSSPKVMIETTEGNIVVTLRPDVAPETVANFLAYVRSNFYKGTIFHRVIPGFMIQAGGFNESMERQQTRAPVINEAKPTVKNLRGTIAMARTQDPDSATSQFFINLADNNFLNAGVRGAGYAVFGKVTSGMGVVDSIASVPTERRNGMADVPVRPVIITSVHRLDQ